MRRQLWDRLQASYWFSPLVMSLLAVLFAQFILALDAHIQNSYSYLFGGNAADVRNVLLGLAATVLGTAGIVFSLLTVPLSVAVSQFGSRLLRLFLRDRVTQSVLGTFTATFVYCVTAAVSIPPAEISTETPQLTATVGLLLFLMTFGSLLALLHHISTSLEAPNLAAAASLELQHVIRSSASQTRRFAPIKHHPPSATGEQHASPIYSVAQGYVQSIDTESIAGLAVTHDLVIRMQRTVGHFVKAGDVIALVYAHHPVDAALADRIWAYYEVGNLRSPVQDVVYAVDQLVEMAVRAMSPAINDPFTAITCADHLGAGLALFVEQTHINDAVDRERLMLELPTLATLLDAAFNMLRRASRDNADVLLALIDALERIGRAASLPAEREEVVRHVHLVEAESCLSTSVAWDQERVSRRCADVVAALTHVT